jgi:hypothetical protein
MRSMSKSEIGCPEVSKGIVSTSTTQKCYERTETAVRAAVRGGESKDVGGDG